MPLAIEQEVEGYAFVMEQIFAHASEIPPEFIGLTAPEVGKSSRMRARSRPRLPSAMFRPHQQIFAHASEIPHEPPFRRVPRCWQIFAHASEIPLTANMLKQLHRDLLQYSSKNERHRGEWKSLPNHVAAFDADGRELGIVFETSNPFDTAAHNMDDLLNWHRRAEADTSLHPLLRIGIFVVVFLAVHPFQDGNGRLSRILTTLLLLRAGYGHVPYSSLDSIIEQNKEAYDLALRRTQTTWRESAADWPAWLLFFLLSIRQQITRLQHRLDVNRPQLSPLARQLAALFETRETLTNAQTTALTGANRSTLKAKFAELVAAGLVETHGKGRGAFYERKP